MPVCASCGRRSRVILALVITVPFLSQTGLAQKDVDDFHPEVPKTWNDAAMATLEIPLADPVGSPKHVSAEYYYRIPVRPIFKQYPVYAPGREPSGYLEWLKQQDPVVIWDGSDHTPPLKTDFYEKTGTPIAAYGTGPSTVT